MAKKRKTHSAKVKAARRRFSQAVDKCIVIASKASAGTRMKTLGRCVKRML